MYWRILPLILNKTKIQKLPNKKANPFTARVLAKINPCELVTSFPNSHPSSTATFFTSSILTFLGLKDVRAQECQIQTPPGKCEPTAKYYTDTRKARGQQPLVRYLQLILLYYTIPDCNDCSETTDAVRGKQEKISQISHCFSGFSSNVWENMLLIHNLLHITICIS